jgi:hypothetical protein
MNTMRKKRELILVNHCHCLTFNATLLKFVRIFLLQTPGMLVYIKRQ